jgi:gliding motility-associated-like protein
MNLRLLLNRTTVFIFSFAMMFCFVQKTNAQCATPINVFPYTEGFEASNGNWTAGGTVSDWAWGTPNKPVIAGAANGSTKCWITGGLTGSVYNNGERSWLQSPCFDFTTVQFPYISFSVFWEMEQRFDGAGFQYSTNLGASWTNVGSYPETPNCLNTNWFNFSPITNMNGLATVRDGWSGNIQATSGPCLGGGGSGQWVNAQHTMPNLAGVPNVIFRFIFGAGTTCNNYDGFAVDDIEIGEAPANNATFTYNCTNIINTVQFTLVPGGLCPTVNWDFGDPLSGANNTSAQTNPTHTFSGPGSYTVTLTATGPDNAPSVYTNPQPINILGITPNITGSNNCATDNNGAITAIVNPLSASPFFYSWNTTPVQTTQTATGLAAGTYTVTVSALNSCQATATAIITAPTALTHQPPTIIQPGCGLATGTATIKEAGGTSPYTYTWSPSGGNGPTATGLAPGNYTVIVTDSKNCFENIDINIATATPPGISVSKKDASCLGSKDGSASVIIVGGMTTYSLIWNTIPVQTTTTAINLGAGIYTVTATDNNNGCSASTSVQINEPAAGSCGDVYFPNAFTPNGDAANPNFGVLGNVAAVSNYLLLIYNRYGELVFYTRDSLKKWDGFYKGKQLSGSYVWAATFTYKGSIKREERGSVVIIR